jgi:hypothetical protein
VTRRLALAGAAYLAVMAGLIYGVFNNGLGQDTAALAVAVLVLVGLLHFGTGYAARSWWALFLPVLAVITAVPAGYPNGVAGEPFPIYFVVMVMGIFGTPLIGAGAFLGSRRAGERAHA